MMPRLALTLCLLAAAVPGPAAAQQPAVPSGEAKAAARAEAEAKAAEGTARAPGALLRGLDKVTGSVRDLPLANGESADFGRLKILLSECRYPADDPGSDAFAELTVTDAAGGQVRFAGWMIASSPALSALDDARYDIWVVSCNTPKASGSGPVSEAGTGKASASKAR